MAEPTADYAPPDVIEDELRRSLVAWIDRNTDWDIHDDEKDAAEDITRAMAQAICIDLAAAGWRLSTTSPGESVTNVPGEHG